MTIISVDSDLLVQELTAWAVPLNYVRAFINKNAVKSGRVILQPFFINDAKHLNNSRHWLAINAAFWCAVYREAQDGDCQIEALSGIRAMFYVAGSLGIGEIKALIQEWWRHSYELHKVPAPNFSAVIKRINLH